MRKEIVVYLVIVCLWSVEGMCSVSWVPEGLPTVANEGPALCQGAYLTPQQGKAILDGALARFPDLQSWDAYARHVRVRIQQGAGLMPWPRRTALNPIIGARRTYKGYSVENVAFESVPGYFVAGNLYRPTRPGHSYPMVLCTHGHTNRITGQDDYNIHGRFVPDMQIRCAMLARFGAIAMSIDMFGCGDSIAQVGQEAHRSPFAMTIQLWNAIRALDFLLCLDCADPNRVAVTGESGGGTQCLLLTALDERVRLSVPVVMVSAHFFGGCPCESGRPIHRSQDHFVNNAMIAALATPRPMLVISDGKDWTSNTPYVEYPFIKRIYSYYGPHGNVANVHLADEGHDYGPSKRAAMYRFLAERFGLDIAASLVSTDGRFDESGVAVEKADLMRVFGNGSALPSHALRGVAQWRKYLRIYNRNRANLPWSRRDICMEYVHWISYQRTWILLSALLWLWLAPRQASYGQMEASEPKRASVFAARFDGGAIVSLRPARPDRAVEYVQPGQRLGDLLLRYRRSSGPWQSADTVLQAHTARFSEAGDANSCDATYLVQEDGAAVLSIGIQFSVYQQMIVWRIQLCNQTADPLEIGDLALPLPISRGSSGGPHILKHSFVSGHGSFLFWMRSGSIGPCLVLTPAGQTHLGYWDTQGIGQRRGYISTRSQQASRPGRWAQIGDSPTPIGYLPQAARRAIGVRTSFTLDGLKATMGFGR